MKKPFAQEAELNEKMARLAELNSLLNMDERDGSDTLGLDEETDVEAAEQGFQAASYAGKVFDVSSREALQDIASDAQAHAVRYADRALSDPSHRDSVIDKLHAKQEKVAETEKKHVPAKKHEQSL